MINVRQVLESHSQATTLRELEAKGRSKVRVINAAEIARLIEDAVRKAIAGAQGGEGMDALIAKSKSEFVELKRQRDEEHAAREKGLRELETARTELLELHDQATQLQNDAGGARARVVELEAAIESERKHGAELRALADALTQERDAARAAERDAREAAQAVRAPIPTDSSDTLAKLAEQVAKLTEKMSAAPEPVAPSAGAAPELGSLNQRLDALTNGIAEKLERFGRSMGVSSAVEAAPIAYDQMFQSNEKLESNLGSVERKQQKGGGIGGALERMKKMRLVPEPPEKKG